MPPYVYLLSSMFFSALAAIFIMPWLLKLCYKRGIYDIPDERKIHNNNIPRLGGMIFIPSTLVGMLVTMLVMLERNMLVDTIHTSTLLISFGIVLIYFIGLLDDLFGLTANLKFAVQLLASLSFLISGLYINNLYGFLGLHEIPYWASCAITILLTMLIVNAINLIDGLDGLASSISLIALAVFSVLFYIEGYYIYCIFSTGLIGSLLVFMWYNIFGSEARKTKTFMGDSGSLILGFSLSYLGIKYAMDNPDVMPPRPYGILVIYTVLLIPVFDLVRVAVFRKLRGGNMFEADKTHVHHKLLDAGRTPIYALLAIIGMNLLFISINFVLYHLGVGLTWTVCIDIAIFTIWQLHLTRLIERHQASEFEKRDIRNKFEQHAAQARKICILTPRFPMPENGGDVLRINNIARQLRQRGYKLVLVSLHDDLSPQLYEAQRLYHKVYVVQRNTWRSLANALLHLITGRPLQCGYYYSQVYKRKLREVIAKEKPDLFISHLLRMTPYLEELGLEERSVIEMTDALSKTYAMSGDAKGGRLLRMAYSLEKHLIKSYERHVMERFPKCVLVSQDDINYLRNLTPHNSSLELHANGVVCMRRIPTTYNPKKICFVGNMRTLQNQDAVFNFVSDILPMIMKREPETVFYIVGAQPPRQIQELACEHIIVTGFVKDLEATIADSCLAVAPVRVAAGIQNKVLVAMGCGLPVVMTSLIAKAIPELVDEENALIQDENAAIAEACIRIMRHPELRQHLSEAGHATILANYSWREKIHGYIK